MLNKQRVAQYFSRAATSYKHHNALQVDTGELLLTSLSVHRRHYERLLDAGCGPATMTTALRLQCDHYTGVDIAPGMLAQAKLQQPHEDWVLGDLDCLPFQAASFDVVVSNLAVQWCTDLASPLRQMYRVLKPGGTALLTTVLADSMQPLMQTWQNVDGGHHGNRFVSLNACRDICARLAREFPGLEVEVTGQRFEYGYTSVHCMLKALKGIGANYRIERQAPVLTANKLKRLEECMRQHQSCDGQLPMRWEIGVIKLIKPQS